MKLSPFFLLLPFLFLTACTTAGPFVTEMHQDGNGEITVKKCIVRFTPVLPIVMFWGTIMTDDCRIEKVLKTPLWNTPPK